MFYIYNEDTGKIVVASKTRPVVVPGEGQKLLETEMAIPHGQRRDWRIRGGALGKLSAKKLAEIREAELARRKAKVNPLKEQFYAAMLAEDPGAALGVLGEAVFGKEEE